MYASGSAVDITALSSSGSDQEPKRQPESSSNVTFRNVKILPVSQLGSSHAHGLYSPSAPVSTTRHGRVSSLLGVGQQRTWLERLLPSLVWMRAYDWRDHLKADVVAGITVGTMLVPQAMSYAKLAGLHPIYGLCKFRFRAPSLRFRIYSHIYVCILRFF